jgi:hypothetical protein
VLDQYCECGASLSCNLIRLGQPSSSSSTSARRGRQRVHVSRRRRTLARLAGGGVDGVSTSS